MADELKEPKLLSCPYCNCNDIEKHVDDDMSREMAYCVNCGVMTELSIWNHRPREQELEKQVAEYALALKNAGKEIYKHTDTQILPIDWAAILLQDAKAEVEQGKGECDG